MHLRFVFLLASSCLACNASPANPADAGPSDAGSTSDAGPSFVSVCQQLVANPAYCTDPCAGITPDPSATMASCQTRSQALEAHSETAAFQTCVSACPVARQCPLPDAGPAPDAGPPSDGGGGGGGGSPGQGGAGAIFDCDCIGTCLAARSAEYRAQVDGFATCLTASCPP